MAEISRIPIKIRLEGLGETQGILIRFWAPRTVEAILRSLPLEGKAALWPGKIYFPIPVKMGHEKARAAVEAGTIAYWPQGSALCLFHSDSKPYSPVNPVGKITGPFDFMKKAKQGVIVRVEKA